MTLTGVIKFSYKLRNFAIRNFPYVSPMPNYHSFPHPYEERAVVNASDELENDYCPINFQCFLASFHNRSSQLRFFCSTPSLRLQRTNRGSPTATLCRRTQNCQAENLHINSALHRRRSVPSSPSETRKKAPSRRDENQVQAARCSAPKRRAKASAVALRESELHEEGYAI